MGLSFGMGFTKLDSDSWRYSCVNNDEFSQLLSCIDQRLRILVDFSERPSLVFLHQFLPEFARFVHFLTRIVEVSVTSTSRLIRKFRVWNTPSCPVVHHFVQSRFRRRLKRFVNSASPVAFDLALFRSRRILDFNMWNDLLFSTAHSLCQSGFRNHFKVFCLNIDHC
jgi:hypothetical protein